MRSSQLDPADLKRPDWNSLKANYDKHDIGEAYFKGRVEQMGLQVEHWGIDMRNHDDHLIFDNKMDLRLWEPMDPEVSTPRRWPSDHDGYAGQTIKDDGYAGQTIKEYVEENYGGNYDAIESHPDLSLDDMQPVTQNRWECRALIDVKTKANEDWLGVTNLRHLAHYGEWASEHAEFGTPVAIYFTMVDMDSETVGERNILVPIPHDWPWGVLVDHYENVDQLSWPDRKKLAMRSDIVDRVFSAPDGNDVVKFREDAYRNFDWFVEEVL